MPCGAAVGPLIEPGIQAGLDVITVETTAPLQAKFKLYLDWKLELPVKLAPTRLVLFTAEEVAKVLTVEGKDGKSISVEKAWIEGCGFRLEGQIQPVASKVEVQVTRGAVTTSKAVLFLKLKDDAALLRIPLLCFPPGPRLDPRE